MSCAASSVGTTRAQTGIEPRMPSDDESLDASLGDNRDRQVWSPNIVWREKVVQWCYDVIDHLEEERSVVYIAMNILDRYCATIAADLDERTYELASLSSIFLAVRVAGSGELLLPELLSMSRTGVSAQDVILTGTSIINELTWDQAVDTPIDYVMDYVQLLPGIDCEDSARLKQVIIDTASYLTEIAVCDYLASQTDSASIAAAALLNALQATLQNEIPRFIKALQKTSKIDANSETIKALSMRLHALYKCSLENNDVADDEEEEQDDEGSSSGPHLIEDDDDTVVDETNISSTENKRSYHLLHDDDEELAVVLKRTRPSSSGF
jgi:Cyclin, N-terminal domain